MVPPKPSLVLAKPGSAYGFKPQTPESTTQVRTSDHRAVGGSLHPTEVAVDSERQHNAIGMDSGANPSINEDAFGKPFPYSLPMLMLYPRIRD